MKLYFKPGELELTNTPDGKFELKSAGTVLGLFSNEKAAVAEYNRLRKKLEAKFPMRKPTPEEAEELLRQAIKDSLVQHNSFRPRENKSASRKTRTFG